MRSLLKWVLAGILALVPFKAVAQSTSFYTDRAVGTFPTTSGVTVLIPIQNGQVRVCTSADIGSTTSPCPHLASITDTLGNPLSVSGGNFGQIRTDIVGRFVFGCTVGNYLIQVAAASSNVPQVQYTITCPNTGSTAPLGVSVTGDVCTNLINTMVANPGGGDIALPAGTFTCSASNYTIPNDGSALPNQASFKLHGVSADAGSLDANGLGKIPTTGTILNFTGAAPGSGGRLNFLGQGQVEISGITFQETVAGIPTLFGTNTILKVHDNYFYGPTFAWLSAGVATRIQTTGGTLTNKYQIDLGAGTNGVNYRYFILVKNQGTGNIFVTNNQGTGVGVPIAPGTTKEIAYTQVNDGSHLVLLFSTQNASDAMDVIAQYPTVEGHGGADANLISGASATFAGSWAAQGGATPTLTQNQTVTQRPTYDAIVLGGNNNTFGGTTSDSFQGYITAIKDNNFNRVRSAVALTLNANKVQITGNNVWVESGSDLQGAIDCVGGCGGNDIYDNNIESFFYKFAVWGHGTAFVGNTLTNNSCFDIQSGLFTSCYNFESGSSGNVVVHSNGDQLSGFSQLISEGTPGQNTVISAYGNQLNVTQAAAGKNSVTLLNEQGPVGTLTGNSADQTVFTFTLPGKTLAASKGLRITASSLHGVGAASVTYKVFFGATVVSQYSDANANTYHTAVVFNNSGVTNAQHSTEFATSQSNVNIVAFATPAEDTTTNVVIKFTFNVANTDQVTGKQFLIELIQ